MELPVDRLLAESELLEEPFYARPAEQVARESLGKVLIHGATAGMIVESEAYLGVNDLAAHASAGLTDRTRVIFGPPGYAYVYFIYGMYDCLNLVCEAPGSAGCVLIRALEPVSGVELMRARRPAARKDEQLASGPGKLTLAMGITRELNGSSLITGPLQLRKMRKPEPFKISIGPRIGISQCADWPLRFYIQGNRFVSRGKPGKTSDAVEAL